MTAWVYYPRTCQQGNAAQGRKYVSAGMDGVKLLLNFSGPPGYPPSRHLTNANAMRAIIPTVAPIC